MDTSTFRFAIDMSYCDDEEREGNMNTLTWFLLGCGATYLIMTNPEIASSVGDMLVDVGTDLTEKRLK